MFLYHSIRSWTSACWSSDGIPEYPTVPTSTPANYRLAANLLENSEEKDHRLSDRQAYQQRPLTFLRVVECVYNSMKIFGERFEAVTCEANVRADERRSCASTRRRTRIWID